MAAQRTDRELLEAWAQDDGAAGETLVRRHFPMVYRFLAARHPDPADLIQRTFLACVESRHRLEKVDSFRAFVLGIARNLLLRELRDEGRHRRAFEKRAPEENSFESLGGQAAMRQEMRLLLRALQTLPLDLQLAVQLYYWEELNTGEIAEILEAPRGTIMSRLHRARELLKRAIVEIAATEQLADETVRNLERWARSVRGALDQMVPSNSPSK